MLVLLMNPSLSIKDINDLNYMILLLSFQQMLLGSLTAGFEIKSLQSYRDTKYGDILVFFIHTVILMIPFLIGFQIIMYILLYHTSLLLNRGSPYFDNHLSIFTLSPYMYIGALSNIYWRYLLVTDCIDLTILGLGLIIPSSFLIDYYTDDPGILLSGSLLIGLLGSIGILVYRRKELLQTIISQFKFDDLINLDLMVQNWYLSISNCCYIGIEQLFFFLVPIIHINDLTYSTGFYLLFNLTRILEQVYQSLATAGFVVVASYDQPFDSIIAHVSLTLVFSTSILSIISIFQGLIMDFLTDHPEILLPHIPFLLLFLFIRINLFGLISISFAMQDLVHIVIAMGIFYCIIIPISFINPWINLIVSTTLISVYLIILISIRIGFIDYVRTNSPITRSPSSSTETDCEQSQQPSDLW